MAVLRQGGKGGGHDLGPVTGLVVTGDTIIDVIEEPVPGVVVVTEYETIRTATPISSDREAKPGTGPETEEQ